VAERKRSRNPDKRVETFFMGFFSADAMSDCGLPPLNQRAIQVWGTRQKSLTGDAGPPRFAQR